MALFSNKKAIKQAKEAAGAQQKASIYGMEAADAANARILAGEEAAANVFGALGQEGTFEPGSGTGTYGTGETNLFDTGAMPNQDFKKLGPYANKASFKTPREGVIDPEGYANATIGTIPFKMRSKQTAEAYQLLNKEGAEWDMLENSTLGTIHEGAALQLRDTLRQLKNNYAKGGTARRTAVNEFGAIQAAERAHMMKTQETWQANLRLHDYVRQNADRVQAGNISYVNSLPGLNKEYRAAMQASASLMVSAAEKAAIIAGESYEIRASQQAQNFGSKLLEAGIMAAVSSALSSDALGAAGDWISGLGTPGEASGKFTSMLGGGVKAIGGDMSGLLGEQSRRSLGLPGYTPEQQAAADAKAGYDANAAVLARQTDPKNTPTITSPGSGFNARTDWRVQKR